MGKLDFEKLAGFRDPEKHTRKDAQELSVKGHARWLLGTAGSGSVIN